MMTLFTMFKVNLILVSMLSICQDMTYAQAMDTTEFISWYSKHENEFHVEKVSSNGGWILSARHVPYQVSVIRELRTNTSLELSDSLVNAHARRYVFDIRMSQEGTVDPLLANSMDLDEYSRKVSHLNGPIRGDLLLVIDDDTLYPSVVNFERLYGHAPYTQFRVEFVKAIDSASPKRYELVYFDQLFNLGLQRILFTPSVIGREGEVEPNKSVK